MKQLSILSLSILFSAACGVVTDPVDGTGDTDRDLVVTVGDSVLADSDGPAGESPIILEHPAQATGARTLSALTIANHDGMIDLIKGTTPVVVTKQRFVTRTAEPVELTLTLAPPTGQTGRTIASDVEKNIYPQTVRTLCANGNIGTFDARCEDRTPGPSGLPTTEVLSSGTWALSVIDESTNAPVPGCIANANQLTCVLPTRAAAAYRIETSISHVSQFWTEPKELGKFVALGAEFAGTFRAPEYQCSDWATSGTFFYCTLNYVYSRFVAIDRAWMAIDPITVEVSANDFVDAMPSAQIQWDAGDDNLPGSNY